jgi:hypothetical protein
MRLNIPSLSPGIGMKLLEVEQALRAIPESEQSVALRNYANALRLICDISVRHQAAVIAALEAILKRDGYVEKDS